MKYNIIQSLPVLQQDKVVMVEQANISMFSKKIKPDERSQVYFSHWRTSPTCEDSKSEKDQPNLHNSLKRREISKVGSVKFYTYQPACKVSNRNTSRSVKRQRKNQSTCSSVNTFHQPIQLLTEAVTTSNNKSFILETLNLSNSSASSVHNEAPPRLPTIKHSTHVLSIKELLN